MRGRLSVTGAHDRHGRWMGAHAVARDAAGGAGGIEKGRGWHARQLKARPGKVASSSLAESGHRDCRKGRFPALPLPSSEVTPMSIFDHSDHRLLVEDLARTVDEIVPVIDKGLKLVPPEFAAAAKSWPPARKLLSLALLATAERGAGIDDDISDLEATLFQELSRRLVSSRRSARCYDWLSRTGSYSGR